MSEYYGLFNAFPLIENLGTDKSSSLLDQLEQRATELRERNIGGDCASLC